MVNTNMIAFDGIGALHVTFASNLTSKDEGKPVKVSASKTVELAGTSFVNGKVVKVDKDGAATVQLKGYMEFGYAGPAPNVGYTKLIGTNEDKVKVDNDNGKEYLVAAVDTSNKIVGLFL